MEVIEVKILVKNLLKRMQVMADGSRQLLGAITDDELKALQFSLAALDGGGELSVVVEVVPAAPTTIPQSGFVVPAPENFSRDFEKLPDRGVTLDTLSMPTPPDDIRLCFDFGTAMSKVALVWDETSQHGYEEIEILKLGIPGDQEEISESMLVSSVYIDNQGLLWFGQMAVAHSQVEGADGRRQRLDNIKRYLTEEGLSEEVGRQFNPTAVEITYGDMVLAYLMFLTWAVSNCLRELDCPRNLTRRFAMPCFSGSKARKTADNMHMMLGQAQLLADTFYDNLNNGLNLMMFLDAIKTIRLGRHQYSFVDRSISEPLGVAGSLLSWKAKVSTLVLVVDVGAGTSDFSLFRLAFDPTSGKSAAVEVEGSSRGISEAGNHLDKLLKGLILRKAGVDSTHVHWINIQGALELNLRNIKEALFRDEEVSVSLFNGEVIDIDLEEFLQLEQVDGFGRSLVECMTDILENVDISFIAGAPNRMLAVALTGGGADLPMVKALAHGTILVKNIELKLVPAQPFPSWLAEEYPELEDIYPRIAVSLGGARKRVIEHGGLAGVTAGDVKVTPVLRGFYMSGN